MEKPRSTTIAKPLLALSLSFITGVALLFVVYIFAQVLGAGGGDWGDPTYFGRPELLVHDIVRANYVVGVASGAFVSAQATVAYFASRGMAIGHRLILIAFMIVISLMATRLFGPQVYSHPSF